MTSFAFILGVLPLVPATGVSANARRSLDIGVVTGMLASTLLAVGLDDTLRHRPAEHAVEEAANFRLRLRGWRHRSAGPRMRIDSR